MPKRYAEATAIEYIQPGYYWRVTFGDRGHLNLTSCQVLCYDCVRELARRRLNCLLAPMTNDEWITLGAELVFAEYEAMGRDWAKVREARDARA